LFKAQGLYCKTIVRWDNKSIRPLNKNNNNRSCLFILDLVTGEEVDYFIQADVAIAVGLFTAEITPWYTAPIGSFVKGKLLKL
jgi:hypothetical protein